MAIRVPGAFYTAPSLGEEVPSMNDKDELLSTLRDLLRDVLDKRFEGVAYAKLSRANGYADGYMAALLDAGLFDRDALLHVVCDERKRFVARGSSASEESEEAAA